MGTAIRNSRVAAAICLLLGGSASLATVRAQEAKSDTPVPAPGAADRLRARAPHLQVLDEHLAAALELLVSASPTADRAVDAVVGSGLPVTIGRPAALVALPEAAGGPDASERPWLLARADHAPVAWMVFRATTVFGRSRQLQPRRVERVWVAVEVDSIEAWIRRSGAPEQEAAIQQDLLVALAHEFVAHVGSIARRRRVEDLCDDPSPEQRRISARAAARAGPPPTNGEAAACALRVENRVRRELNRSLGLRGKQALAPRRSYSLEAMRFAAAFEKR